MSAGSFATVINCMDGRTQEPARRFLRDRFAVDCVDVITEAGPCRILAEGRPTWTVDGIRARLGVSVDKHGSRGVAVVAHEDCAGNPVDRGGQLVQLAESLRLVRSWFPEVEVIGIWLAPVDWVWVVEEVSGPGPAD